MRVAPSRIAPRQVWSNCVELAASMRPATRTTAALPWGLHSMVISKQDSAGRSTILTHMVALVTGGGRGIGQGIALRLAKQGWAVAVTARSEDQLRETVRQSGGRMIAVAADMADPESIQKMVSQVE